MPHQLPHLSQLSHSGQNGTRAFHSQAPANNGTQQTHAHSSQPQAQTQPQPQPPQQLPPLQPPALPYPQPYSHHLPHHSPYDPVHAASAAWFHQGSSQGTPWPAPAFHGHHAPPTQQGSHARPSGTDSHFGGPGSGSGLVQPFLGGPTQQFPPHHQHDPYSPFNFPSFHRPAAYPRSSIVLPVPPQLSNQQAARQDHPDENQPSQPNQVASSHSPPVAMSADRGAPPPARRGFTLPSLNPNSNQPSAAGSQPNQQTASDSREPSPPAAAAPPANHQSIFRYPDDPPRASNRGPGDALPSAATPTPQLPLPSEYPTMEFNRTDGFPRAGSGQPAIPPNPNAPSFSGRRRHSLARRIQQSDHDSDEDLGSSADEEEQMMRYMDEFGVNPAHFRSLMAEDHIRATQLLRGQLTNKRVASRKALSQLQSVDLDSLSEAERTCVICYNDFGQRSPEGVIEAPLRLPRCQHVFGDHCIKKWFEESDSCPYCRDKVPSELAVVPGVRAFHNIFRMRNRISGGAAPSASEESMFRLLAQQEQHDAALARYHARQQAGSDSTAPPRPPQRRSPPSDAENRRRTRIRHSSFHPAHPPGMFASAPPSRSSTGAPAAPGQQSPTRERPMPGNQRYFYTPMDSGHPSNAAARLDQAMPSTNPSSAGFRMSNPAPMQIPQNNNQPPYYPNMSFGNVPPPSFSQHLPPLGTPSFQNAADSGNGVPNAGGAEGQMQ
ncbi:hypothetical protein C8A01DRAFT_46790 [Parachaetomium inaequale]|uniref:RING-type domain-containing protein n=1 Tax=Parachaetomium inaequale TaxID=2588326 RepID=A0AAN6PF45_9PEZI|nr:hypothetical protein C8A01DRAFT_46790 [Parachaetomium inaequale]